jgi:hypothetical protein
MKDTKGRDDNDASDGENDSIDDKNMINNKMKKRNNNVNNKNPRTITTKSTTNNNSGNKPYSRNNSNHSHHHQTKSNSPPNSKSVTISPPSSTWKRIKSILLISIVLLATLTIIIMMLLPQIITNISSNIFSNPIPSTKLSFVKSNWQSYLETQKHPNQNNLRLMNALQEFINDVSYNWDQPLTSISSPKPLRQSATTLLIDTEKQIQTDIYEIVQSILTNVFNSNAIVTIDVKEFSESSSSSTSSIVNFLQKIDSLILNHVHVIVLQNFECCTDLIMSLKSHVDKDTMQISKRQQQQQQQDDVIHISGKNYGFLFLGSSLPHSKECCSLRIDTHLQNDLGWKPNMIGRIGKKYFICSKDC